MENLNRKIIRRMILHEAKLMKEQRILAERNLKIAKYCAAKEAKMLAEGYDRITINESIFSDILGLGKGMLSNIPSGFLESLEQMVIEKLLKSLFGDYDPDTFLGAVIANTLENIDIKQIGKYFGEGACDPIVETLFKGITEAIAQKGMDKLFGQRSEAGYLASTMREALTNALNETSFQENIKAKIKDVVCNFDFAKVYNSLKSGMGNVGDSLGSFFNSESTPTPTV
jgi:hypothetical protein